MICRSGKKPGWAAWISLTLVLAGCTTPSLDMSDDRIEPPGPDAGVVIGSVLVQADQEPPQAWYNKLFGRKAGGFTYEFEIVHIGINEPIIGTAPYTKRYELEVKPGKERFFVARLPSGNYLFKAFHHEGFSTMGGDLRLLFSVAPDATQYVGRLLLEFPRRVTLGTSFTYKIEDGREAALAVLRQRHPDLAADVVDTPMQSQ
ncbi:hypothetical protein YTPLAS18_11810 [Nitrospira sp.]|nr:hypothetical protein YTPLAS18_11810 [Nitrospira sp.]